MANWNPEQYLKFKKERTQAAIDLARRIDFVPTTILDVGCGPGNSTAILKEFFPNSYILGIDSSEQMIEKAGKTYPEIDFKTFEVPYCLDRMQSFDLIFSNACLQWIPHHESLIPALFSKLNRNGQLLVQIPENEDSPFYKAISDVINSGKWDFSSLKDNVNRTLDLSVYFDILSSLTDDFDIWETVYYHKMPSLEAILEWTKGTRLRPYLDLLDTQEKKELQDQILEKAAYVIHKQKNGKYIFKFKRLFFKAVKAE